MSSKDSCIKLPEKAHMEVPTQVFITEHSGGKTRSITCNRGLGEVVLPYKVLASRPGKLGRYKTGESYWMILSVELDDENPGFGHTSMVYQTESDLEGDACSFTLQWIKDINVTVFTNNKRELKFIRTLLNEETTNEWGMYIPARRSPAAVRLNDRLLQLWISI